MKKGKILAGLLAALLILSILPVGAFAALPSLPMPTLPKVVDNDAMEYNKKWVDNLANALTATTSSINASNLSSTLEGTEYYAGSEQRLVFEFTAETHTAAALGNFNTNTNLVAKLGLFKVVLEEQVSRVDVYLTNKAALNLPASDASYKGVGEFISYLSAHVDDVNVYLYNINTKSASTNPVRLALDINSSGQYGPANFVATPGTRLSLLSAADIGSARIENGATLDLKELNLTNATLLQTKLIHELELLEGSSIDFPKGTTWVEASKWLSTNNLYDTGFSILVNGVPIGPKPSGISITPLYGVYRQPNTVPSANKYFTFKGTIAYLKVDISGIAAWSEFQGLYPYLRGNTSKDTKFIYQDLTSRELQNGSQSGNFSWLANAPYWVEPGANGTYSYYIPVAIGADEASQDIQLAFTSVKYDNFWGNEFDGVFHLAAKDLPKVTNVQISPETATVAKGGTQAFYTQVYLENDEYLADALRRDTSWSVSNNKSSATKIDKNGILTVGAEESAGTVIVTAKTKIYGLYSRTNNIYNAAEYVVNGNIYYLPSDPEVSVTAVVTVGGNSVPPAPATLKIGASHASPTSISLNWNAAAGATGYSLYQASSSAGSYQLIATNTQSLSAVATGLYTGSYYWFKAAAVDAKGEIAVSDPIQVRARPLRPASISAAAGSRTGSAKVTWGSVAECGGYAVYASTSRTGTYTLKSVVSGRNSLSAQVTGLKSGATYYFKVASYVQVGPAKVPSVYTGVVSAKAK